MLHFTRRINISKSIHKRISETILLYYGKGPWIFSPWKMSWDILSKKRHGEELTTPVLEKGSGKEVMLEVCKEKGIDIRNDMRKKVVCRSVIGMGEWEAKMRVTLY